MVLRISWEGVFHRPGLVLGSVLIMTPILVLSFDALAILLGLCAHRVFPHSIWSMLLWPKATLASHSVLAKELRVGSDLLVYSTIALLFLILFWFSANTGRDLWTNQKFHRK